MNSTAKQLFDTALALPDGERAELAARLIESLDPQVDMDVESAWSSEIARRIEQLDSGEVTAIPWPQARRLILGLPDESPAD